MARRSKRLSGMDAQFDVVPPPAENVSKQRSVSADLNALSDFCGAPHITEDTVRDALRNEAKRHKYWKANVAKKITIDNIENGTCFHYVLESFTEMRSTSKAMEGTTLGQFLQQQISSVESNTNIEFNPWDYELDVPDDFVDQVKLIEMPGSSKLVACTSCNAEGLIHCFHCRGYGTGKCTYCRGTGMKAGVAHPAIYTHPMIATFPHSDVNRGYPGSGTAMVRPTCGGPSYGIGTPVHFMTRAGVPPPGIGHHDLCHFCQGRGIRSCTHCNGQCKKPCTTCAGTGTIRTYVKLRIQFAVQRNDYYTQCEVPEKLLSTVNGQVVIDDCHPSVLPIKVTSFNEINEISRRLCTAHTDECSGRSRIIKQRHRLEAIPVAKIYYRLGSRDGIFWLFGLEHNCYVDDYPSKCTIL